VERAAPLELRDRFGRGGFPRGLADLRELSVCQLGGGGAGGLLGLLGCRGLDLGGCAAGGGRLVRGGLRGRLSGCDGWCWLSAHAASLGSAPLTEVSGECTVDVAGDAGHGLFDHGLADLRVR
jgi:hypothetical protein